MNKPVIYCENLSKSYADGTLKVDVLSAVNLSLNAGQSLGIVGASGSGKSTLMHLLGGLDTPTSGRVEIMGRDLATLSQKELGRLRNRHLGFVYQFHHLLPEFNALENVAMALMIGGAAEKFAKEQAFSLLKKVGLEARVNHRLGEMSGGERQRCAIARALVTQPSCVLADEPTGNLDRKNAYQIFELMMQLKDELGSAIILVTHDDTLASHFDTVLDMQHNKPPHA